VLQNLLLFKIKGGRVTLIITDLHIHIPQKDAHILSDIDVNINSGEKVALVGASGCGKSSVLEAITGKISPIEGSVSYEGKTINSSKGYDHHIISHIGYLPQHSGHLIFPWHSVKKNIEVAQHLGKRTKEQPVFSATSIISRLELTEHEDKYPGDMSGGERRRLALGMILSFCAKLVLLDEPFTGADQELRDKLRDLVWEYYDKRRIKPIIIIVTHDVEDAALLCDETVILKKTRKGTISPVVISRNGFIKQSLRPSILKKTDEYKKYLCDLENQRRNASRQP